VPVIALTANEETGAKENVLQAGMSDIVTKPIEIQDIHEKIRRWLPDELIHEQALQDTSESPNDQTADLQADLPVIEGIDTRDGICYLGSKELFISLLGHFYKLIDLKAAKIEKYLSEGDIRTVTIEVHSLKNTAQMIGAGELSEGFGRLERYGNEGNREALERETPAVLQQFRSYKSVLKPFGETAGQEKKAASGKELISLLQELKSAIHSFDLDGADEALSQLEALRIPPECLTQMETLQAYVADVAMEEVMELAEAMIQTIEKIPEGTI
ncbi:MAG: hypothetical protein LBR47_05060, partial [Spirochaetaceae bacterium]|nr:hypothetical protein [Spirochaetaceae bacterium]